VIAKNRFQPTLLRNAAEPDRCAAARGITVARRLYHVHQTCQKQRILHLLRKQLLRKQLLSKQLLSKLNC